MNLDPSKAERIILSEKAFDRAVELSEAADTAPSPKLVELMKRHKARQSGQFRPDDSPSIDM